MAIGGCSSTPLKTSSLVLSSISIKAANPGNLEIGSTEQITATAVYSNGSTADVTLEVTWKSSDISKATISSSGLVKGVSPGFTNITASKSGITSPPFTLMVGISHFPQLR